MMLLIDESREIRPMITKNTLLYTQLQFIDMRIKQLEQERRSIKYVLNSTYGKLAVELDENGIDKMFNFKKGSTK